MIWLILQMLTCLVLAAGLGVLLGWWLRGLGVDDTRRRESGEWERRLADYKQQLEACRADCQTAADQLAACEARSAELARRLAAALAGTGLPARAQPPAERRPPGGPPTDPETWVVTGEEPPETEES